MSDSVSLFSEVVESGAGEMGSKFVSDFVSVDLVSSL